MDLHQRKPGGPWHVAFTDPHSGKRVRQTTGKTNKRAATSVAVRIMTDVEEGRGQSTMTLMEALSDYHAALLAAGKQSAEGTLQIIGKILGTGANRSGRWCLPGDLPIHRLTPQHIADLTAARSSENAAAQTIAHEIKTIRAACLRAVSLRRRGPDITRWTVPKAAGKLRYLSAEEYQRVLLYMDPARPMTGSRGAVWTSQGEAKANRVDARELLVILAMTGARWSEITGLVWEQVALTAETLTIYGEKTQRERLVGLPPPVVTILQRRFYDPKRLDSPYVFPGVGGGRRTSSCRAIIRAMDAVDLNRPDLVERYGRATVHSLRHTFASLTLQAGADLAEVQDALGHASPIQTRRYAHLARGRTASKLAGLIGASLGDHSDTEKTTA
jgi:integrase